MPSVRWYATSAPNQPRLPPPPMPALASRRPWLPIPARMRGENAPSSRRVKIWITPPIASEPYRLERGPRTISMRSIWSTGRSWNAASPALTEPTRTPSTSTSTWSASAPRINTLLSLPGPPWLPMSMPARPRSRSVRLRAWLRTISSWSMTWAGNRLSARATPVRVAVTTTSSRSVAAAPSATASDGADRMPATASARIRDCIGRFSFARTHARETSVEARTACTGPRGSRAVARVHVPACEAPASVCSGRMVAAEQAWGTRRQRRRDALRIAIGRGRGTPASWPVSGLASWSVRLRPRRLPVLARCGPGQWRMRWRDSLTVAGAVPDWPWRDARGARGRLHRLPVSTRWRTPPGHREAGRLYAIAWRRGWAPENPGSPVGAAMAAMTRRQCIAAMAAPAGAGGSVAVGLVEQPHRRRVGVLVHDRGGDRCGGGAVARWRQLGDGGLGGLHQLGAAFPGHILPVAVAQRAFQRVEQVEAGLEAGALDAHESVHRAGGRQVFGGAQADLAQPCRALRADVAHLRRWRAHRRALACGARCGRSELHGNPWPCRVGVAASRPIMRSF